MFINVTERKVVSASVCNHPALHKDNYKKWQIMKTIRQKIEYIHYFYAIWHKKNWIKALVDDLDKARSFVYKDGQRDNK